MVCSSVVCLMFCLISFKALYFSILFNNGGLATVPRKGKKLQSLICGTSVQWQFFPFVCIFGFFTEVVKFHDDCYSSTARARAVVERGRYYFLGIVAIVISADVLEIETIKSNRAYCGASHHWTRRSQSRTAES